MNGDRLRTRLHWLDDFTLEVDGVEFRLLTDPADMHRAGSTPDSFVLGKNRTMVTDLLELDPETVATIVELGIFKGGSVVLLEKLFHPRRLLCVDLLPDPVPALEHYLDDQGLRDVIVPAYGTSQADRVALGALLDEHVPAAGIDLAVDDASHFYPESKVAFEIVFPRLRPGGIYILEDWGWAHWPGAWQEDDSPFGDRPFLSNLVFELVMLAASRPDLVSRVDVRPDMVWVHRGPETIGNTRFDLSTTYLSRGAPFLPMP